MRSVALVLLIACSSDSHVMPDARPPTPIAYALSSSLGGTRTDLPQVFIDGVAEEVLHQTYPDLTSADGFHHTVELRYGDHVLASYDTTTDTSDCTSHVGGDVTGVTVDLLPLDSGDIRYFGDSITTAMGGCIGDGSAAPACYCPAERCAPRITLAEPLFSRMACAPIGPRAAGDPCTLIDSSDGAYDDCGTDLVCYQGTCRAFCSTRPCATTCVRPDGYPPEATFCM